jgi:hypothetical protein
VIGCNVLRVPLRCSCIRFGTLKLALISNRTERSAQDELQIEEVEYANRLLPVGVGTISSDRLRCGTNDGDDDDHDARSDHDGSRRKRGRSNSGSACGSRRNTTGLARTQICLDTWLLALDRDRDSLSLGIRELGLAAAASRCVGAGLLDAQSGRLGVDRGPLAVN